MAKGTVKDVFRQYDVDRSGLLTYSQCRSLLRDNGIIGGDAEALINYFDKGKTQSVSFNALAGGATAGSDQGYNNKTSPSKKKPMMTRDDTSLQLHQSTKKQNKNERTPESLEEPMELLRQKLRDRVMGKNKTIRQVFMEFDTDGSGYLDYDEFKQFMYNYGCTKEEAEQAIEYLDRDYSGEIDYDEFAAGLLFYAPPPLSVTGPLTAHAAEVFKIVRTKLDQRMRSKSKANLNLRDEFGKYDVDGNGSLDYDEFGAFLLGMGIKLKKPAMDVLLQHLDEDMSEKIEFVEFIRLFPQYATFDPERSGIAQRAKRAAMANGGSSLTTTTSTQSLPRKKSMVGVQPHSYSHSGGSERSGPNQDRPNGSADGLWAVFNKYDIDGSGVLDYQEFSELMQDHGFSPAEALQVIKQLDQDRNNRGGDGGSIDYQTFANVVNKKKWKLNEPKDTGDGSPNKKHSVHQVMSLADVELQWVNRVLKNHSSLEDAFREHDSDGSGELDLDEFRRFMKHYGIKKPDDIEAIIAQLDTDNSGTISFDEFARVFNPTRIRTKISKQVQKDPAVSDELKDRLAALRELELAWMEEVLTRCDSMKAAFQEFDRHHRNELDYEEFRDLMGQYGITDESNIRLLLKRLDTNNSGTIELDEFLSIFNPQRLGSKKLHTLQQDHRAYQHQTKKKNAERVREQEERWIMRVLQKYATLRDAFISFDVDHSGSLNHTEIRQLFREFGLTDEQDIARLIRRMDVDDSGSIDYEEFATIFYEGRVRKRNDYVRREDAAAHQESRPSTLLSQKELKKARMQRMRDLELKWIKRVLDCHGSIEAAFHEYDEDGNGELDAEEFTHFMKRNGITRDEDIESLLKRLDLDGSGAVDYDEFCTVFNEDRLEAVGNDPFQGDEVFTPEEVESILEIERELAERMLKQTRDLRLAFRKFDTNGNGRLEYKEFRAVLKQYKFPEPEIKKVIRHLDKDVSGFIDYREFVAGFAILPPGNGGGANNGHKYRVSTNMNGRKAKPVASSDTKNSNGSGNNTRLPVLAAKENAVESLKKQLLTRILSTHGTVQSVFRKYDTDKRGCLSPAQFELLMRDHHFKASEARQLMEHLDRDRNGSIEYEESLSQLVVRANV
ncbi:TPA: hypothetical protein N0F65_010274 [Lagenidium giganteum]|uniref:EF-hand domain-containing protein n=1 Tax=Lagenidium giganteum TaxID=4803 RepID=A0AAV2YRE7_9STRA|nr:TPA: hypothetical protein N0F65_010274 [Lagenidium giganteum]